MSKQQLLVIGNGMVGHHFIEQLVLAGGLERGEQLLDPLNDGLHRVGDGPRYCGLAGPSIAQRDVPLIFPP